MKNKHCVGLPETRSHWSHPDAKKSVRSGAQKAGLEVTLY